MPLVEITEFSDERLDAYARLTEAQLRNRLEPKKGIFIAESPKVIARALKAGYEPLSFLMGRHHLSDAKPLFEPYPDLPVFTADDDVLAELTGFELTRGVLAAMRRPHLPDPRELIEGARRIAVLDGIVDHTNVGAAFRSAAALGIDAVLITPTCCDPLYRRAVRVSMGTVFQVPWTRIGDTVHDWPHPGIDVLHEAGFHVCALALREDATRLGDPKLHEHSKLALVMGTEGDGLSKRVIDACDEVVYIPMMHGVDSLNVAAASAVTFWELCKTPHQS